MPQQTFAEVTFEQYRKPTRQEWFLDEMNCVVPWTELVAAIEPVYPKAEGLGRPAEELAINVIKNGVSIFTRDSSYGGFQINEGIMSRFNVSYEEAEKIKLGGTKVESKDKGKLEEVFTSVISGWVNEIKRALDFLVTTYPDEPIEKIYISGGSCRIPGFQKYLEVETGIPVGELNPFANLQINEKLFDPKYLSYMAPQAAVAVGLALRSIGDK